MVEGKSRRFYAPGSAAEFAGLLEAYPDATILAGGTDVGLWVTKQLRELETVIYTGRVSELHVVEEGASQLEIGAAVTLSDAIPLILRHYPQFAEVFTRFASPPIRNAATLGGNVANGSPIGDSMPLLLAVDASLVLHKGSAQRTLPLSKFYSGYQQTALGAGEFIECIRIPLPAGNDVLAAYKVSKRFDQDISAVCAAFRLRLDGGRIEEARIALGGMAEIPRRAKGCERFLTGRAWSLEAVTQAAALLEKDFTPISDMRSSAAYRMQVCKNLLLRFFHESSGDASPRVYNYGR